MTEAADGLAGQPVPDTATSRRGLGRRLALAAAAVPIVGGVATALAPAAGSATLSDRDREVLRFARMLEQLQAAFYAGALSAGKLTGEPKEFAQTVGAQEQAHLRYLGKALGTPAGPHPRYHFGDAFSSDRAFVAAAVTLEETGVASYNGQAENVTRATLRELARVMSVEGRHAAWARAMAGKVPAPVAADVPISAAAALRAIRPYTA